MARIHRQYIEETGVALVTIKDKFGVYEGRAKVHEEDRDLESEKTGLSIAEMKARIERERKRAVRSQKALDKARIEVQRAFLDHEERVRRHAELQKELGDYLEGKEKFRKTYRAIQIRKQKNRIK